jgi:hypothetical protein
MTRRELQHMSASEQVPTTRTTRHDVVTGTRPFEFRVDEEHPRNDDALAPVVLPLYSQVSRAGVGAC